MKESVPRKKNAVDRRSLIMRKGYDAITVEDICEEANVGRSTFYLHYPSKDALKRSGLEHLRNELAERQKHALASANEATGSFLGFSLALFEHASGHIDLYRALVGSRGGSVAIDGVREILSDLVRGDLATNRNGTVQTVPSEVVVQYVVGAYMAVLTWWLDRGAKPSPQKMDEMFRHLATNGIARDPN